MCNRDVSVQWDHEHVVGTQAWDGDTGMQQGRGCVMGHGRVVGTCVQQGQTCNRDTVCDRDGDMMGTWEHRLGMKTGLYDGDMGYSGETGM